MIIHFPKYHEKWGRKDDINEQGQWHRYYNIHYKYLLNIFKYSEDVNIIEIPAENFQLRHKTKFEFKIDDNLCLFDFSDHFDTLDIDDLSKYNAIFKLHYNEIYHSNIKNMFPFTPVNFDNWKLYKYATKKVIYKASGVILNNQTPNGNALERRTLVQNMLREYTSNVDFEITNKKSFYEKGNNCLTSICVPGARNDMLDRGQCQYFALGVATISPELSTVMSFNKKIIPDYHYIKCNSDYINLIEKIEWVKENPELAIEIGKHARKLFLETSTINKQIKWIKQCIK